MLFLGNTQNDWPGDGAEDEPAAIQPPKYAQGGAVDEQAVPPQHIGISGCLCP